MASGFAKGAKSRGKRIAFGDGKKIIWDHHSEQVFRHNPNIAPLGSERDNDLEWVPFYRGNRIYNTQGKDRWIWNYSFKAIPGEMFLNDEEESFGKSHGSGFIVIEPNVPEFKTVSPNKQWPIVCYRKVARELIAAGYDVVQFNYNSREKLDVRQIKTPSFRHAIGLLKNAVLYIGPEGGLHHGCAAVATPAVVLFGGFIAPAITGYDFHTNLTGGAKACGKLQRCVHCADAMSNISVNDVLDAASLHLKSTSCRPTLPAAT